MRRGRTELAHEAEHVVKVERLGYHGMRARRYGRFECAGRPVRRHHDDRTGEIPAARFPYELQTIRRPTAERRFLRSCNARSVRGCAEVAGFNCG